MKADMPPRSGESNAMSAISHELLEAAESLDRFVTVDLTGLGLIRGLYKAAREKCPGPMCLGAADLLLEAIANRGGPVFIATGFPMGGGVAETDGPVGAALLARALERLGAAPVVATDDEWIRVVEASLRGAGLTSCRLEPSGKKGGDSSSSGASGAGRSLERVAYLRQGHVLAISRDEAARGATHDWILNELDPSALVAVERPGRNRVGAYHGVNGRPLAPFVANMDDLFERASAAGIPTLGIGDAGNELGMGLIKDELPRYLPRALECGCPCGAGVMADWAADRLVVSSVSHLGAVGLVAALALRAGDPEVLHAPEEEARSLEYCARAGAVDGASLLSRPAVDGVPAAEWEGLALVLNGLLRRTLDKASDWRRFGHDAGKD